jgi:hypothetical protein
MVIEYTVKYSGTPFYDAWKVGDSTRDVVEVPEDSIRDVGGVHYLSKGAPLIGVRHFQALNDETAIRRARSLLPDSLELREILLEGYRERVGSSIDTITIGKVENAKLEELTAVRKVI